MIALVAALILAPLYEVRQVPAGEDSVPVALAGGNVLGNSARGPWIWEGGASVRYLFPGDTRELIAIGFNARGDVVGYELSGNQKRAFVHANGALTFPATLGGSISMGVGIAGSGRVVGDATTAGGQYHSFVYENGSARDLGTLGGEETMTVAVSPGGNATGESQAADGSRHAFLWDGHSMRDLGTLGGEYAQGQAVNDKGMVAGLSELVPGDHKIHAFLWDGSQMRDLGILPGLPWTSATGVNEAGVVVGNVYNKPDYNGEQYDSFAYVHRDGAMQNLNALIPPSSFTLTTALGVNDAGQILCTDGQVGARRAHGYLLTPR
jgi:probable HAF family extracellular repeat protein